MIYNYKGAKVFYEFKNGESQAPVILLHGWGRSCEDFNEIIKFYPYISFLVVDFPPFGKSSKEIEGWGLLTYADMLTSLCEELNIHAQALVGHSFGGRIAIIVAATNCTLAQKCILIDSAGIKPKRSLGFKIKRFGFKIRRCLHLKQKYFGSADYQSLSPAMKKTFNDIVNTPLDKYAKKIKAKTLLVWGKKDNETPLYMAKKLLKLIPDSSLKIMEHGTHFSFLDCPLEFASIFIDFLEEE